MIFDLLHVDGKDTMPWPYEERRRALEGLGLGPAKAPMAPAWQVPRFHVGDGAALAEASRAQGLEGMVAKRLGSPYRPGRRSADWRKVKHLLRQAMVVGGWLPGEGRRSGEAGALLVGYQEEGRLRYAGRVGTGFTESELRHLTQVLTRVPRAESPFHPPPQLAGLAGRQVQFVEPALVVEVAFGEWTHTGTIRHPRYLGMRQDRDPKDVTRES
jgi:bifunctional non-homologous end joining protein LigD